MTHDNTEHDSLASSTPPDRAAGGDVSTSGVSSHDVTGGHGGHDVADIPDVSTLAPTGWKELLLPVAILVIVAILLWGPVTGAFQSRPASAPTPMPTMAPGGSNGGTLKEGLSSSPTSAVASNITAATTQATSTQAVAATLVPTQAPAPPATAPPTGAQVPDLAPTQTAVAQAGELGEVARVPVELSFAGITFVVKPGDELLPDWTPETDTGIATWIPGTVANHILYVPYTDQNAALFQGTKSGDKIDLTMNTGQVFEFSVAHSGRAINGPADKDGEFTVTSAMSQDHAGVTLFLIGDPAPDRAVVKKIKIKK